MTRKKPNNDVLKSSKTLRERAEEVLHAKAADRPTMPTGDVQALVHELSVYQIELEIQNEELRQAQVELAQSRDRYSDLYEYAPIGYLTLNKDSRILEANLRAATMLGVDRQHLLMANITRYVARNSQDDFYRHRQAFASDEMKHVCELEMHHADGHPRIMLLESIACSAAAELRIRTALIDITERKRNERQLVEYERFNRATLDALSAHVAVIDARGKIVATNQAWRDFSEANNTPWQSVSEGTNYLDVCDRAAAGGDADAAVVARVIRQVISGEPGVWVHEYPCHSAHEQRWFYCRVTRFPGKDAVHVVVAHENITAMRRAQDQMQASEVRLSTLLNAAADGVVTINEFGVVQSFNRAAEKMFGYAADEIIGENVQILMPSPYFEEHDGYLKHYRETGEMRMIGIGRELTGRRKDGTTFALDLSVSAVNHLNVYMGLMRDVSQRKQLERQIVEIASLEQQRIGQDLHDSIGQQLTGMILLAQAFAELAASTMNQDKESNPTKRAATSQQLSAQVERLRSGLQDALQDIRTICRELVPVPIATDGLQAALEQLIARASSQSSVTCTLHCPFPIASLDNVTATHLFNIAQGALCNALRHAQAGEVQVRLEQSGKQLVLSVRDDGAGIPPKGLVGLGLRIMQNRAQLIGGILAIRSVQPKGTEVTCMVEKS